MLTVDPIAASVHHIQVSDTVGRWAASDVSPGPNGLLNAIAIAVAIMLMSFALKRISDTVTTLIGMVRMLFSAVWAAALVLIALAVLLGAIVVPAILR